MLSLLFFIIFIAVFGKMIGFAFRASWSIFKALLYLVFLPLFIIALVFGGLIYLAFPILLVAGLVSLLAEA